MYPILFHSDELAIYSYGLFVTLGFVVLVLAVWHEARRHGRPNQETAVLLLASLAGAAVGSRLVWILILGPSPELLNPYTWFSSGGTHFHYLGILIGGYLGGLMAKLALDVKEMIGDPFALGLPAMMVLVRIGCFLGGCCYGKLDESLCGAGDSHQVHQYIAGPGSQDTSDRARIGCLSITWYVFG